MNRCQCESCKRGKITEQSIADKKKKGEWTYIPIELPYEKDIKLKDYYKEI